MKNRLGWIEGNWGLLEELHLPINDRGLNFGDGVFETIFIFQGKPKLIKEHLNRWHKSASLLDMKAPPKEEFLEPLIEEAIDRASLHQANGALRLNWSRGNKTR